MHACMHPSVQWHQFAHAPCFVVQLKVKAFGCSTHGAWFNTCREFEDALCSETTMALTHVRWHTCMRTHTHSMCVRKHACALTTHPCTALCPCIEKGGGGGAGECMHASVVHSAVSLRTHLRSFAVCDTAQSRWAIHARAGRVSTLAWFNTCRACNSKTHFALRQ